MEEIHCPYCQRDVPVSEINMQRFVGRCLECGKLFELSQTPEFASRDQTSKQAPERPRYAQPKSVRLQETLRGSQILIRWFGPQYIFLAFFCLFWDGFLVVWYSALFFGSKSGFTLVGALFPLLHVVAGVFITYTCLAGFLNTTTIEVENGRLRLAHGPLPWNGNRDLDATDIKQFFVVERIGNKGSRRYELCALQRDGTKLHILDQPLEVLRFVEQHLEEMLKIKDERVLGEFAG
jgi:hypothetical protein